MGRMSPLFFFLDTLDPFLRLFSWHKCRPVTKEHKAWGIFSKTRCNFLPCQLNYTRGHSRGVQNTATNHRTNSPGVFVNIAACCNWHNCQVRARNKLGVLLASTGRVIKGTCFWRRSRGHRTRKHVGATARLIKWLPLILSMHMKGLCLLHDRFYASSPRDLPRYTRTEAGKKKTMYHMCSLILPLSTEVCVCICACMHLCAHLKKQTERI